MNFSRGAGNRGKLIGSLLRGARLVIPWAMALWLIAVIAARIIQWFPSPLVVLVVAIAPLALVVAWPLLAWALIRRRRRFLALAALAIVCQLWWARLDFGSFGGAQTVFFGDVRIATLNVRYDNPTPAESLVAMVAADPDVLVLQEVTPEIAAILNEDRFVRRFPYRIISDMELWRGTAIISRLPLSETDTSFVGREPMTVAKVALDDGTVLQIVNVHLTAPLDTASIQAWEQQFGSLSGMIERRFADPDTVLVVVGDFNATAQHRGMHELNDVGLRSVHRIVGSGWDPTFPNGGWTPTIVRLDHHLVEEGLDPVAEEIVDAPGSDHLGVVASFEVAPAP